MMRIGELATRAGVSVRALRYYEEQGLLTSERSASGQRLYPEGAVFRVGTIQELYAAGLSSKSIRTMLPCVDNGQVTPELLAWFSAEREKLDRRIGDLVGTRDRLDAIIAASTESWQTGVPCRSE